MKRYLVAIFVLLSVLVTAVYAKDSVDPADWLDRMVVARKNQSYSGTFVFGHGDEMSSMKVMHRLQNGIEQERLIALDGEPREIIRKGDKVTCIYPGKAPVELEQVLPKNSFAGGYIGGVAPMPTAYSFSVAGMERLAGYAVVKVAVMAKDKFRYSYLLWLEKETGLMVKSMLTGADGEVLEHFQFTTLMLGGEIDDPEFYQGSHVDSPGSVIEHSDAAVSGSLSPGPAESQQPPLGVKWRPGWMPQGFALAPFMSKANNVMPETSRSQVFTDGLTLFSVFVDTQEEAEMPEGGSRMGATSAYSRYFDLGTEHYVVTVVGEVPIETVKKVADNMRLAAIENSS